MNELISDEEDPWFINEDEQDAFEFKFKPCELNMKPISKISKTILFNNKLKQSKVNN